MTIVIAAMWALATMYAGVAEVPLHYQGTSSFIPQPANYVEFSANVTRTIETPEGSTVVYGRVFRSGDGSLRYEWFDPNGQLANASIRSVRDNVFYAWNSKSRAWRTTSVPASTDPSTAAVPRPRSSRMYTPVAEPIENFEVLRNGNYPNGGYSLDAPQLNFFSLFQHLCDEQPARCEERRYSQIKVQPQPPELFVKP